MGSLENGRYLYYDLYCDTHHNINHNINIPTAQLFKIFILIKLNEKLLSFETLAFVI